jgi:hypothetical protein
LESIDLVRAASLGTWLNPRACFLRKAHLTICFSSLVTPFEISLPSPLISYGLNFLKLCYKTADFKQMILQVPGPHLQTSAPPLRSRSEGIFLMLALLTAREGMCKSLGWTTYIHHRGREFLCAVLHSSSPCHREVETITICNGG